MKEQGHVDSTCRAAQADDRTHPTQPAMMTHSTGTTSNWTENAIWWHVYPLGFVGATIRPDSPSQRKNPRGLDALIPWLDHAKELGCTGLLLGPIFQSQTHGYDTTDFKHIDDRLGGDLAFDRLVAACADKDMQLILDGVFNHVGNRHPAVKAALDNDSNSPFSGLIAMPAQTGHQSASNEQSQESRLPVFEGHAGLVELDHRSTKTVDFVADVMNYWLDRGAHGWRLDAAYSVDPEFWAQTLPLVRRGHPSAWIFGEVIHGDYPKFVQDSTVDSVTQYELWKSIWSSIADGNFFELDWNLQRHNAFLDSFVPQTFIGNHDVTRIATRVGIPGAILALSVLMTVGGLPSIYYGDEYAMLGVKEDRLGGDDAIRPTFPENPEALTGEARRIFDAHRELIALRRNHPWLQHAKTRSEHLENRDFIYRSTDIDGTEWIVTHLHLDPTPYVTIQDAFETTLYDSRQSAT
jgi:glycosidase